MRKIIAILMVCFLGLMVLPIKAATYENDMRGVWISTVYNLDYPSTKNNITAQQNEFITKLDTLQAMGINTVFVQVRPKADALYASSINPWSDVLTGTQGKSPGYDPMAFMIEETHKRGMEFHAWLNPYRVTTSGTNLSALAATHPARLNPSWVFSYNNALYYNPELEAVKQHIVDTVKEIVTYYDVDGIHFDDYFYPSSYPLPTGESKDGTVANGRREAINDMVRRVSITIKSLNASYSKSVKFGISPPGIWKNSSSDATGSNTSGRESYYAVFADCRTWIQNEWIDYIAPQIYWQTGHSKADYETLVKWWSEEVSGTNVKLYIGQGIYTDVVATEIDTQLNINKKYSAVKGSIYFSLKDLLNNRMSCKDKITNFYKNNGASTGNSGSQDNAGTGNNSGNSGSNNNSGNSSTGTNSTTTSAIGKTGTVTATTLNIRAGARVDRDIVATVNEGTSLTILDVIGDWYKVKLVNGTVGWANGSYIKVSTTPSDNSSSSNTTTGSDSNTTSFPAQGTVIATTLNVRSGARVDREIVAKVTKDTKVTVASQLGDWYKIKLANGTVGWASKEYIQISSSSTSSGIASGSTTNNHFPKSATVTASSLNIRSGARADRPLVTTVVKGTKLTLLDSIGDWYKVRLTNGTVGWAIKTYIA